MIQKKRLILKLLILTITFICINVTNTAYSQEKQNQPSINEENPTTFSSANEANKYDINIDSKIESIRENIASQNAATDQKIDELENLIQSQREFISDLGGELKFLSDRPLTNGATFEVWSGILLACVGVIVTVLGVAIAIISFIGGKTIIVSSRQISEETSMKEAKKVATEIATKTQEIAINESKRISLSVSSQEAQKVALEVANKITPEAAEKKLNELVDQGKFNHIILEAVDKISLSNMADPENYKEEDLDESV